MLKVSFAHFIVFKALLSITQEIPGVLGALGQKRYKDEMYISYYTLQYHKYAFQIDVMLDGKFHINLDWVMASKRVKHHIAR